MTPTWTDFVAADAADRRRMILGLPAWQRDTGVRVASVTPRGSYADPVFRGWSLSRGINAAAGSAPRSEKQQRRERARLLRQWRADPGDPHRQPKWLLRHPDGLPAAGEPSLLPRIGAGEELIRLVHEIRRLKSEAPRHIALGGHGGSRHYWLADATAAHLASRRMDLERLRQSLRLYPVGPSRLP